MELKYVTQFSEEEIIELINVCNKKRNEQEDVDSEKVAIERVEIEPLYDEQIGHYLCVKTYLGNLHFNHYTLTDFSMRTKDRVLFGPTNVITYDKYFISYMAAKFRSDYLKDLYQHRINMAAREIKMLSEHINHSNNGGLISLPDTYKTWDVVQGNNSVDFVNKIKFLIDENNFLIGLDENNRLYIGKVDESQKAIIFIISDSNRIETYKGMISYDSDTETFWIENYVMTESYKSFLPELITLESQGILFGTILDNPTDDLKNDILFWYAYYLEKFECLKDLFLEVRGSRASNGAILERTKEKPLN